MKGGKVVASVGRETVELDKSNEILEAMSWSKIIVPR
jgi:hypothetical protein